MKLCIFTFSPVQSFISQSRKLSDLFNSSFILSYLTESLIEKVQEGGLGEVIYPVYRKDLKGTDLAGYPNRLVLKTEQNLCPQLKRFFENVWEELCEHVVLALGLSGRERLQFERHVSGYFQPFCHCMDFINRDRWLEEMKLNQAPEAEDYGYTYDLLERYLGALKSFRPYEGKIDEEACEGKYPDGCTLCGERPALAMDWDALRKRHRFMLSDGEKLCGLCLTKRFAMGYFEEQKRLKRRSFPSTSDLAWALLKQRLIKDREERKNFEYIRAVEQSAGIILGRIDCSIKDINADLLDPDAVSRMMDEAEQSEKEYYRELLLKLNQLFDGHGGGYKKPRNSYFAILMADGDNMGVWLGLSQEIRKEKLSESFHRRFSKALSDYSVGVYQLARGRSSLVELVYAGGDDVLAVGYPTELLSFAGEIQERFSETLEFRGSGRATMSAGFVIGHEGESLRFLLEEARQAEKEAKHRGRDRICISVVPRNSQPVRIVLRWQDLELFKEVSQYFREVRLSQGLPYALREELWVFRGEKKEGHREIIKTLLRRVLKRKSELRDNVEGFIERLETAHFLDDVVALEALFYSARFFSKVEVMDEAVSV